MASVSFDMISPEVMHQRHCITPLLFLATTTALYYCSEVSTPKFPTRNNFLPLDTKILILRMCFVQKLEPEG